MKVQNHVHMYKRVRGQKLLYICALPHCFFKIEKILLPGKAALCNICRQEFILTYEDLRRAEPRCMKCSNTNAARHLQAAVSITAGLLPDEEDEINREPINNG